MKEYFIQILLKKIKTLRRPYGHTLPLFAKDLKEIASDITNEYQQFIKNNVQAIIPIDEFSEAQKELNKDKKWKALLLFAYGTYNTKILKEFSSLINLIEKNKKEIKLVMFSTLEQGKEIQAHKGNNHGVLRIQLGIDVPESDKCGLKVEDKTFHLRNNEVLIFDDTFEHSAWNHGNKNRTVLIIDFKKPLKFPYNLFNKIYLDKIKESDYVQSAFKKI